MPPIVQYILELIIYSMLCASHSPFPPPPLPMETTSLFSIRYRDLSWGIGSHDYGGWEVPQSAVCKLEAQGSQWCGSHFQALWPKNESRGQGGDWGDGIGPRLSLQIWHLRGARLRVEDRYPSSSQESKCALLLTFVLFRPSAGWTMPTRTGEGNFFHSVYWFKC